MNKLDKILNFVIDELEDCGGKVYLYDDKKAYYNGKPFSTAYFDYPQGSIKFPSINIGWKNKPEVLAETLLHEFNHFIQWKKQTKIWKKFVNKTKEDSSSQISHKAIQLELECEQMTIKLIRKQFSKDVNLKKYIKNANSYLQFYLIYKLTNRWYDIAPYTIKSITNAMPSRLIKKIDNNSTLSPKLIKEYMKCYKGEII